MTTFRILNLHKGFNFLLLLAICFAFIQIQGCSVLPKKKFESISPEESIQNYLQALQGGDIDTTRRYFPGSHTVESGGSSVKPCLEEARKVALENTVWRSTRIDPLTQSPIQFEVTFEEPNLNILFSQIMRKELEGTIKSDKNAPLEEALCEKMAESLAHTSKEEVSSFDRRTSIQCFTLVPTKDKAHWIITNKTNTSCKTEL